VLKLDVNLTGDDLAAMRGNTGGALTVNYVAGGNTSSRRVLVWTDLSAEDGEDVGDISFATTDRIIAGKVAITEPRVNSSDMTANVTVPKEMLFNPATGRTATAVYVIITADVGATGSNATERDRATMNDNNRGGGPENHREFARFDNIRLLVNGVICCTAPNCECNKICECAFPTEWTTVAQPSCQAMGSRERLCSNGCGSARVQAIAALGHTYGEWSEKSAPTCVAHGERERTCSRGGCGDVQTSRGVVAMGHNPGAAATCTTDQTCTRCSVVILARMNHSPRLTGVDSNCTQCTRAGCTDVLAKSCPDSNLCAFHRTPDEPGFLAGRILQLPNRDNINDDRAVQMGDAIQIMRRVARLTNLIGTTPGTREWNAALINPAASVNPERVPGIARLQSHVPDHPSAAAR
jgi:hypothetical protein